MIHTIQGSYSRKQCRHFFDHFQTHLQAMLETLLAPPLNREYRINSIGTIAIVLGTINKFLVIITNL